MVFLNEFTSQIFDGIDIRTQEKIIERTFKLHKLSFSELNDLSILYFELLLQVLTFRVKGSSAATWLPKINSVHYVNAEKGLGKELYDYLKGLEKGIEKSYIDLHILGQNSQRYTVIEEKPLSLAFWLLSSLTNPIGGKTCGKYYLEGNDKFAAAVEAAQIFYHLSHIIT